MHRLLSLVIVIAHLGAMAVPCVEPIPSGESGRTAAAPRATAMAHSTQTRATGDETSSAADRSGPLRAELEMSAPCLCGCCKKSNARGTVTPTAQTLASRPAESPLVVATPLPVEERHFAPGPAAPVELPEPIPIPS